MIASAALAAGLQPILMMRREDFSAVDTGEARILTAEVSGLSPFVEAVPSWNVMHSEGRVVRVELRPHLPGAGWYDLGAWSPDPTLRTSVNGQKDEFGRVDTDVLVLSRPATGLSIRLTLGRGGSVTAPWLKGFWLALTPPNWSPQESSAGPSRILSVPEKAQHDYPGGNVLCSPTSVSMLMNRLAGSMDRPDLALDVPEVQRGVFDPAWGGTGNWPFNTAFPGSKDGVQAFVARLSGMGELEAFLAAGIPVACSVDYKHLLQKEWDGAGGHLVVAIGIAEDGSVVVNDPAKGSQVRQTYDRLRFAESWRRSKNTVYIVHSEAESLPGRFQAMRVSRDRLKSEP